MFIHVIWDILIRLQFPAKECKSSVACGPIQCLPWWFGIPAYFSTTKRHDNRLSHWTPIPSRGDYHDFCSSSTHLTCLGERFHSTWRFNQDISCMTSIWFWSSVRSLIFFCSHCLVPYTFMKSGLIQQHRRMSKLNPNDMERQFLPSVWNQTESMTPQEFVLMHQCKKTCYIAMYVYK